MAWSKYMEDNQDYFAENMSRNKSIPIHGVDINGLVLERETGISYALKKTDYILQQKSVNRRVKQWRT